MAWLQTWEAVTLSELKWRRPKKEEEADINYFLDKKKNRKLENIWPTYSFLWYDNFGENQTPLQRNGMAAIPKLSIYKYYKFYSKKVIKFRKGY